MQTVENNVALTPVLESKNTVKPLSADLKKAPVKILAGKEKGRKELFEKSALEKSEYQILHLMPKVLNKLVFRIVHLYSDSFWEFLILSLILN